MITQYPFGIFFQNDVYWV